MSSDHDKYWDGVLMGILKACDAIVQRVDGKLVYNPDLNLFQNSFLVAERSLLLLKRFNPPMAEQMESFIGLELIPSWDQFFEEFYA